MEYLPYAGIGSRKTPDAVQHLMVRIGQQLALNGFTLRSGGADGADLAFEAGVQDQKEIFIPWTGFNGRKFRDGAIIPFTEPKLNLEAYEIASRFHPAWEYCSEGAKRLHMRNVAQVLGADLKSHSKFVVCWTPSGNGSGGTGQALRIAKAYNIPIYDLGIDPVKVAQELATFCEYLKNPEIADPH